MLVAPALAAPTQPALAQPGIAFDQIDHILLHGATPPPIGSFETDAAAIASLPRLDADTKRILDAQKAASGSSLTTTLLSSALGMIPLVGSFLAGAASHAANAAAQANLDRQIAEHNAAFERTIRAGTLSRFSSTTDGRAPSESVGMPLSRVPTVALRPSSTS